MKQALKVEKKQTIVRSTARKSRNWMVVTTSKNAIIAILFIVIANITRKHNIPSCNQIKGRRRKMLNADLFPWLLRRRSRWFFHRDCRQQRLQRW
jgi:hypothetical protein